jgi:uncharacterized membrane protein YeiH
MLAQQYIAHINILLESFLIIGVIASSISGALRAIDSKMDITGALLLAFIVANAGGTMRDLILHTQVFWMVNHFYIWLSLGGGAFTFAICYFKPQLLANRRLNQLLLITDAIGLSIFSIAGVEKSFLLGQPVLIAIMMALWTAVGGGVCADVIANRIPLVFCSELYITVALLGAVLYILLCSCMLPALAAFIAAIFMVTVRILSVKYGWKLAIINT